MQGIAAFNGLTLYQVSVSARHWRFCRPKTLMFRYCHEIYTMRERPSIEILPKSMPHWLKTVLRSTADPGQVLKNVSYRTFAKKLPK